MRALVLLSCLALASCQYHYGPNTPAHPQHTAAYPQSPAHAQPAQAYPQHAHAQHAPSTSYSSGGLAPVSPVLPVEYNKAFYTYTAPNSFNDDSANNEILQGLRKNLRVLFIRGPESNGLENALLNLARANNDDHTAIYVLNKQADAGALAQQLQGLQGQGQSKPEVHFVRYRTEADALNAQRAIQSQYDNLPGLSTSHADGAAPVINFASAPSAVHSAHGAGADPAGAHSHSHSGSPSAGTHSHHISGQAAPFAAHGGPQANYLPPHRY